VPIAPRILGVDDSPRNLAILRKALAHEFDLETAASGGTGLGLAICREIIEGHEGRIWAGNREAGDARFAFEVSITGPRARTKKQQT
jgi:signal transduction histidine kinase